MSEKQIQPEAIEDFWHAFLTKGEHVTERRWRNIFKHLPDDPRCKICYSPFSGIGGSLMKVISRGPSNLTTKLCDYWEKEFKRHPGGAEVELTMLFADVRGSTTLAERMGASEFSYLINRFYQAATDVLIESFGIVDRMIGDEVFGMYLPGIAGSDHARLGVEAAQDILRVTGHDTPKGPWVPVGVGVHTGIAYVGTVGSSEAITDFTALGDAANTAARLASQAATGEVVISAASSKAAGLDSTTFEERILELKGREEPVFARVIHIMPS